MNNNQILLLLSNFRYLFKDLSINDGVIMEKLYSSLPSKHMIFPCDIIDLRKILFNRRIEFNKFVPLFSQVFAGKFLKRYSIFLVIDTSKIDTEVLKYGGLYVIKEPELDIRNSLVRIIINNSVKDNSFQIVKNILNNLKDNTECIISNSIPGISSPDPKLSYKGNISKMAEKFDIIKIMMEENPEISLRKIFENESYREIFNLSKEIEDLHPDGIKMNQKTPYHKYNLMDHTLGVLKNVNRIMKEKNENKNMRILMNLAALFHDFGKMKLGVQKLHPKYFDRMQYIGHERESAIIADNILKSFDIDENDRRIVSQITKLHMKPHQADKWTDRGKRNFLNIIEKYEKESNIKDLWKYTFYFAEADEMSSNPDKYNPNRIKNIANDFKCFLKKNIDSNKRNKMSNNWYNTVKKAQVVEPRAVPIIREDMEIVKGPKKMSPQYYKGMRVRDRRKGMVNPQEFGVVDSISDNIISIIWNPDKKKKRKEKFDMVEDTEILSLIVAEI